MSNHPDGYVVPSDWRLAYPALWLVADVPRAAWEWCWREMGKPVDIGLLARW